MTWAINPQERRNGGSDKYSWGQKNGQECASYHNQAPLYHGVGQLQQEGGEGGGGQEEGGEDERLLQNTHVLHHHQVRGLNV